VEEQSRLLSIKDRRQESPVSATSQPASPAPVGPVAYATSGRITDPELDVALAAFARRGVAVEAVDWADPSVDWSRFRLVLVRSVWDYIERREEFLAWARKVAGVTRLANPVPVLERNTDKTYLRDLAEAGVAVVPTHWVAPGERLADGDAPWAELVVKPTISSGARDTVRTTDRAVAEAHVRTLTDAGRTAMVQPYLPMVEQEGETSLLFLGGEFSHAVRRGPMLAGDGFADRAREPDADQLALAEQVLAAIPERAELAYARVDLVRTADGSPVLIELELTEPRLFLNLHPAAPDRLAAAAAALA